MTSHEDKISRWLPRAKRGVEIGAFKTPLPLLRPFYVDCFEEYAGERCLLDFKGDACHLPFVDSSLDYVATSHVLEHVANPIAAFVEWARVLKPGGIVYAVIPDRRYTWDRNRPITPFDHLLQDYKNGTTQKDATHVDDFIDGVVWQEYAPGKGIQEREDYRRLLRESVAAGYEINIHFHVFEANYFPEIVYGLNDSHVMAATFELLDLEEQFPSHTPNGFLVVLRVNKCGFVERLKSARGALGQILGRSLVKPGTKRYSRRD